MAFPLVILSHPLPPEWISSLQERVCLLVGPVVTVGFAPYLLEILGEVEGILCLLADIVDQALLDAASRLRVTEMACENLLAGLDGVKLPNHVNLQVYRD